MLSNSTFVLDRYKAVVGVCIQASDGVGVDHLSCWLGLRLIAVSRSGEQDGAMQLEIEADS